jgi:hypothetical protein
MSIVSSLKGSVRSTPVIGNFLGLSKDDFPYFGDSILKTNTEAVTAVIIAVDVETPSLRASAESAEARTRQSLFPLWHRF